MAYWLWGVWSELKFFIVRTNGKSSDDDRIAFIFKRMLFLIGE